MKEIILANQGEMALKGLNRATFESVLMKTMRRRLSTVGEFKVYRAQSTMYAEPVDENHNAVRFCTNWSTREEDVQALLTDIAQMECP